MKAFKYVSLVVYRERLYALSEDGMVYSIRIENGEPLVSLEVELPWRHE